jgi:DNA primase
MNVVQIGQKHYDLDDIRERVDLRSLFDEEKIPCPWSENHRGGDDSTPSLHIYPDGFYCFGCGRSGDGIDLLQKLQGMSFYGAVEEMAKHQSSACIGQKRLTRLPPIPWEVVERMKENLLQSEEAQDYLRSRGVQPEFARRCLHVGYSQFNSIAVPHVVDGEVVNIKFRIHPDYLAEGQNKYTSPPNRHFRHLWPWGFFHQKGYHNGDNVFITEGEFDALLLLQAGLPALSVSSGVQTDLRPWVSFLKRFETVFFLYDMDEPGDKAWEKIRYKKDKLGYTLEQTLEPTQVYRICFPDWGKDVTDAREHLIPFLKWSLS